MTHKKAQHDSLNMEQKLNASEAFITQYKKPILAACVAVVVLVGGYFAYRHLISIPRQQKANEMIFKGEQYFAADEYEKVLNGDGQGFAGMIQVAKEYGSTPAGNLAKLYAGLSLAQTGKYEEALTYLKDYDDCGDAMVSAAAIAALGNCHAQLGHTQEGIDYLLKAAKRASSNSLSPLYLLQAGELYESLGQKDKALECYNNIKRNYANSMVYAEIDKYIARVSE